MDKGVAIADKDGKRSVLEADSIVFAVGLKADDGLVEALQDKVPEVYAIGDCVEPRKVIMLSGKGSVSPAWFRREGQQFSTEM